ncbi:hypothetical protein [uncultured Campylobacter sp.]|uniref:hypothetical protein n=1 Tax=uncultured Campylobacter sp. TaxID=218934 RepID=UPI00260C22EE|nr:hypothetical protein [uncultured Campylobacter sp.]
MEFKIYSLCTAAFGAWGAAAERKILAQRKILAECGILTARGILKFKDASAR